MSNSSSPNTTCPSCPTCPACPNTSCPPCPPQITMNDIIKAVMPGKSPFYAIGEFKMNGENVDQNVDNDLTMSATDRWEMNVPDTSGISPHNPAAQGIMPYSDAIRDIYSPYKLDDNDDKFNMEEAIDFKIDEELVKRIRIPNSKRNRFRDRGMNNLEDIDIDVYV